MVALLRDSSGGTVSGLATAIVLPVLWIALYGNRTAVLEPHRYDEALSRLRAQPGSESSANTESRAGTQAGWLPLFEGVPGPEPLSEASARG